MPDRRAAPASRLICKHPVATVVTASAILIRRQTLVEQLLRNTSEEKLGGFVQPNKPVLI